MKALLLLSSLFLSFQALADPSVAVTSANQDNTIGQQVVNYVAQSQQAVKNPILVVNTCTGDKNSGTECDAIKEYPRVEKLAMDGGKETPLCKSYWRSQHESYDRKGKNKCGTSDDTNSEDYEAPTRKDLEKRGLTAVTIDIENDPIKKKFHDGLLNEMNNLKKIVSDQCCKGNEVCQTNINNVDVSFCQAERRPTVPDPCINVGYYTFSSAETASVAAAMNSPSETPRLSPGLIKLSPYVNANESMEKALTRLRDTMTHELFHACDLTHAQMVAQSLQNPKAAATAKKILSILVRDGGCDDVDGFRDYYSDELKGIGESQALADCLFHSIDLASDRHAPEYCPEACKSHYYLELFAETAQVLGFSANTYPATYPFSTCLGDQDKYHPQITNVLECLAQNSPKFQQKFKQAFQCSN